MKSPTPRDPKIKELRKKILECIECERYTQSMHALERHEERDIDWNDALYVLKTGYHEMVKDTYADDFQTWKYSIRGKTLEGSDIRIIIAFQDDEMYVITVMNVSKAR